MPPSRTRDDQRNAEASSSKVKSNPKRHHHRNHHEQESSTAPGVQKVKAALRQTRRLLAKDNLAADVRVETERRLKALEAELHQAEVSKKERAFAVRYHKVKFFERQKVTRKLVRTKKSLESAEDESDKTKLSSELHESRVDLNYILHYPKAKKYISLFPPEVRKGEEASPASNADAKRTSQEREGVRKWIQEQMEHGDLPEEPELELVTQHGSGKARAQKWPQGAAVITKTQPSRSAGVQEDDFFEVDENDETSS
ncbi:hypothetical protein GALMADRAFT_248079 [Galerina marginata CBS 339.88]|uniref:rRNA-processing protein EFG1 n=1 Tax=Galerina marginata (strain CBS 339.88) TaxID=685588 RepID=A0A067SXC6_GALM3|nr:hypothetical protein GALMADRAFT_248079 [Galerina marginata CBS 339.88]